MVGSGVLEIEGIIASCGFASGDRVVVGSWFRSPLGAFTDVMWAEPDGRRRLLAPSDAVADLVTAIHASNVIVYVEPSFSLPADMAGRILLQTTAGEERYLRIQVRATLANDQLISVIGHELRHAVEVAADTSVVDDAGLRALYKRIGHVSNANRGYDTDAAQDTGRKVRAELVG